VEEAVIRGYAQGGLWPHRWVTLFILRDLQPLIRQLRPVADPSSLSSSGRSLPTGAAAALDDRPVVNVYDLADPAGCHVFVNRQAMKKEGYWDDPLAIRALLAHEHAHPLAENETINSSRCLQLDLSLEDPQQDAYNPSTVVLKEPLDGLRWPGDRHEKVHRLLTLLADKLCLYAPREVFANEMTIRCGFGKALLHLDRHNVASASRSVAGREELSQQLAGEVTQGNLTSTAADVLLLIGDLKGYLDLALEVVSFYRTGWESEARELESALETAVFPYLEPQVIRAYAALRELYSALRANLRPSDFRAWGEGVLSVLTEVLAEKGLRMHFRLRMANAG